MHKGLIGQYIPPRLCKGQKDLCEAFLACEYTAVVLFHIAELGSTGLSKAERGENMTSDLGPPANRGARERRQGLYLIFAPYGLYISSQKTT